MIPSYSGVLIDLHNIMIGPIYRDLSSEYLCSCRDFQRSRSSLHLLCDKIKGTGKRDPHRSSILFEIPFSTTTHMCSEMTTSSEFVSLENIRFKPHKNTKHNNNNNTINNRTNSSTMNRRIETFPPASIVFSSENLQAEADDTLDNPSESTIQDFVFEYGGSTVDHSNLISSSTSISRASAGQEDAGNCHLSFHKSSMEPSYAHRLPIRSHATEEERMSAYSSAQETWNSECDKKMPGKAVNRCHRKADLKVDDDDIYEYDGLNHDSTSSLNSGTASISRSSTGIEISPGVFVALRGSEESWHAIQQGFYTHPECFCCSTALVCIADADYVLCPECRVVSPITSERPSIAPADFVGGVGLGLRRDILL